MKRTIMRHLACASAVLGIVLLLLGETTPVRSAHEYAAKGPGDIIVSQPSQVREGLGELDANAIRAVEANAGPGEIIIF